MWWPVVLVVDCRGMGASVAALARGFAGFHPAVAVTGVVLNNVAGARHESLLRSACEGAGVAVFGHDAEVEHEEMHRDQRHDKRSEEHTSELQSLMRISYAV